MPKMYKLEGLGFNNYKEYLNSDLWWSKRNEYFNSNLPQHCISCLNKKFDLHHRSYKRLGNENIRDLLPLCRDCHYRVHEWLKKQEEVT